MLSLIWAIASDSGNALRAMPGLAIGVALALLTILLATRLLSRYRRVRQRLRPTDDEMERLIFALGGKDPTERRAAVKKLQDTPDGRAVEGLIRCLRTDDWQLRQEAIVALGRCGDRRGTASLIRVVRDFVGDSARELAVIALGEIADPKAIPALLDVLESGDEAEQASAQVALGRIPGAAEALRTALRARSADKRRAALQGLSAIGDSSDLDAVAAGLRDPDVQVRKEAVRGLGEIGGGRIEPYLATALGDPDPEVRGEVAQVARTVDEPGLIALLSRALEDSDSSVRCHAAGMDARTDGHVDLLEKALGDADSRVRENAVNALGRRSDEPEIPQSRRDRMLRLLRSALRDPEPQVRARVPVACYGFRGAPEARNILLGALDDPDVRVRETAAWAVELRRDSGLAEALLPSLCDPAPGVRVAALRALATLSAHEAAEPIGALLKDECAEVRASAARALASVQRGRASPRVTELVRALIDDENEQVRREAGAAWRAIIR